MIKRIELKKFENKPVLVNESYFDLPLEISYYKRSHIGEYIRLIPIFNSKKELISYSVTCINSLPDVIECQCFGLDINILTTYANKLHPPNVEDSMIVGFMYHWFDGWFSKCTKVEFEINYNDFIHFLDYNENYLVD